MTVGNNREYQEQVRPGDKQLEMKRGSTSSRVVAQGTAYLESKQVHSSDIEGLKDVDSLAKQASRLEAIAERLLNQVNTANDRLHRGNNETKQGRGCHEGAPIASTLGSTEEILEKVEKELIVLCEAIG